MGKTKNNKKYKRKFSRKNKKTKGGGIFDDEKRKIINPTFTFLLSILLVGIFFIIQCIILDFTYKLQMSIPYMRQLHEWVIIIKNIRTFFNKLYSNNPNNPFTKRLDTIIVYLISLIPNDSIRTAVHNMIPTVIMRPNLLRATHNLIKTSENSQLINILMKLSIASEQLSEWKRIFKLDINAVTKMDTLYNININGINVNNASDMLHFVNNYETKLSEIMNFLNNSYNVVSNDPSITDITGLILDVQPLNYIKPVHKLLQESDNGKVAENVKEEISDIINKLSLYFQNNSNDYPSIEEIGGGKKIIYNSLSTL